MNRGREQKKKKGQAINKESIEELDEGIRNADEEVMEFH